MKRVFLKLLLACIMVGSLVSWMNPVPEIFLIGDSIAGHYRPFLEHDLDGIAKLNWKHDNGESEKNLDVPTGANGGDSRMVLAYLQSKLKDPSFKPDYVLLNCGLHDIKRDPKANSIQVTETDYRKNLNEIVRLLSERGIKLIFVNTTRVVDSIHNAKTNTFKRYEADVLKRNGIACDICRQNHIPLIDLHRFSVLLGVDQILDHVHYKEPARALQAAYIAGYIQSILKTP